MLNDLILVLIILIAHYGLVLLVRQLVEVNIEKNGSKWWFFVLLFFYGLIMFCPITMQKDSL